MRQSSRWRPVATGGLAGLVAVLAIFYTVRQLREGVPANVQAGPTPSLPPDLIPPPLPGPVAVGSKRATVRAPEGPAMRIEPVELARAGRERDDNGIGMRFCWCPPGVFHLGALPEHLARYASANPVSVTIGRGFWIGKFEVTQSQWRRVMGVSLREQRAKDPTQPRPVGDGTHRDHVGEGPDHPIYYTSHADAEEFCRTLTEAERLAGRLEEGWEYRLPTEAQWEFACRAGTTSATSFGDRLGGEQANFDGTQPFGGASAGPYLRETTPVGHYPANAWGLHDMHGNVWEWCRDGFTEPPAGDTESVAVPESSSRTYRGGCWHNPGALCLSTMRVLGGIDTRGSGLGFRVALVEAASR